MDEFLQLLIAYLAKHDVAPPELKASDKDREKSYLYDLPDNQKDPDHVFVFRNYLTRHASLVPKNVGVKYVQILVRAQTQKQAYGEIQKLYLFLLQQSENADECIRYLDTTHWVIFDCQEGPVKISIDERGRHIWGLNIPIKTNIY